MKRDALDRFAWFIDRAAERNVKVIWLLGTVPCEYADIPPALLERCKRDPQAHLKGEYTTWSPAAEGPWRDYVVRVLERVGDRLAAAEVWNEPNDPKFLRTRDSSTVARVRAYMQILRWTYPTIKARAPRLPVLAGALAYADAFFLSALYTSGLAGLHDGISVHPYSARPELGAVALRPGEVTFNGDRVYSFRSGLEAIHEVMRVNGEARLPIWITEFGAGACPAGQPLCAGSEQRQADWAAEAFLVAGRNPSVAAIVMHELIDSDHMLLGALRADGSARPVLNSIRHARRWLGDGVDIGSPLRPDCLPAPFGSCVGQPPTQPVAIANDLRRLLTLTAWRWRAVRRGRTRSTSPAGGSTQTAGSASATGAARPGARAGVTPTTMASSWRLPMAVRAGRAGRRSRSWRPAASWRAGRTAACRARRGS